MRGFTLIETLVYLALFTLIIGGFVAAAYMLFETSDRNQTKAMLQEESSFLIGKINLALSGVQSVTAPASNTSGPTLSLTKYGGSTVTMSLSSGALRLGSNTLSNTNVTVGNLVFTHTYAGGTNPESVEAGFTISAKTPNGMTIAQIASTTRYIRK